MRIHVVDAADKLQLLFQRELCDPCVGLGFNVGRVGRGRLRAGRDG